MGTRECSDTMPVYPGGNTRTYHPVQYFHELMQQHAGKRFEGLVGGWMPAVRKIFPADDGSYCEIVVLRAILLAKDRFIVQTWHRTAHIRDGKILEAVYGYSYPALPAPPPRRRSQKSSTARLLEFAEYWDRLLHDLVPISLPDASWTRHGRITLS